MKKSLITEHLLKKYLDGDCSPEEKRIVEDWYYDLDEDFNPAVTPLPFFDEDNLFGRISAITKSGEVIKKHSLLVRFRKPLYAVAALAAMVLLFFSFNFFSGEKTATPQRLALTNSTEHVSFVNNSTAVEEKRLPDGSVVWLHPGSSLTYDRKNGKSPREVRFEGEGFFEVTKDSANPFVIYSGELTTKVLGTSFNIQAIPNSKTYNVSVVTGQVKVSLAKGSEKGASVVLLPNQQASFNATEQSLQLAEVPGVELKKQYWKPVTLRFANARLDEVAKELEKEFKIAVVFSDPTLANCRLKVNFSNYTLPQVFDVLEKLLEVECDLSDDGKTLLLNGKGCE